MVSYGIVVYKSAGPPQLARSYLQRLAMDENVQYLLLSLLWFLTTPVTCTLIPFVVFSLFHVLTFVRSTAIPLAFPAPSGAGAQGVPAGAKRVSSLIQGWVKANYDPAMRVVAYAEIVIFSRLLLGVVARRNSIAATITYLHFLRLRFHLSAFSRLAILHVSDFVDQRTQDPRCPQPIRQGFLSLRGLVAKYGNMGAVQVQGPNPPAGTAANATAAAPNPAPATATSTATTN